MLDWTAVNIPVKFQALSCYLAASAQIQKLKKFEQNWENLDIDALRFLGVGVKALFFDSEHAEYVFVSHLTDVP